MVEKRKNENFRWHWRKGVFTVLLLVGSLIFLDQLLTPTFILDYPTKTSLDPAYLPTAQYLLEHPEPDYPLSDTRGKSISLSFNDAFDICIVMRVPHGQGQNAYFFSEIYLNNEPASFMQNFCFACEVLDDNDCTCRCYSYSAPDYFDEPLEAGLHLLEIRVKYSRYSEPVHIHRWAFEVE